MSLAFQLKSAYTENASDKSKNQSKTLSKTQDSILYWLVKCQIPDPANLLKFKTYQKKHAREADAMLDHSRLIREHGGGGCITPAQLKDFEIAQHRLSTCDSDARGQSVSIAVEYFIRALCPPHFLQPPEKSLIFFVRSCSGFSNSPLFFIVLFLIFRLLRTSRCLSTHLRP
jgi:hypothetical protein